MLDEDSGYSPKRLMVLIEKLPEGSHTIAALRGGPQFVGWDYDRYVAVAGLETQRAYHHAFVSANSKQRVPPPKPIPQPAAQDKTDKSATNPFAAQVAARMSAVRKARNSE